MAKQIIRARLIHGGLCVTIEPTLFIYKGGEEAGYVIGVENYPRFPASPDELLERSRQLMNELLEGAYQESAMLVSPHGTEWVSKRE